MNSAASTQRNHAGFTLVELMISMVLGLILVMAAVSIVVSSLTQMDKTQAFSEILDNGRVAMAMMGRDVAQAGFLGEMSGQPLVAGANVTIESGAVSGDCDGDGANNSTFPTAGATATFRMFWGETVSGSNALNCITDARNGTDLIQIKRLVGREDRTNTVVESNRVYAVMNSSNAVIFNGSSTIAAPIPENGQYYEYQHRVYFVANVARYGESSFPVLVRETLALSSGTPVMTREEIAEGVEDLRILYGIDDNGDASVDRYATAEQVGNDDWDQVDFARILSAQVSMLMRAVDADRSFESAGGATYNYGEKTVNSTADGIRRKVISSTFSMRNQQIQNGA